MNFKIKVFFENEKSSMGGYAVISIFKLMWWIFTGKIKPKEDSAVYYIRKIENNHNERI